MIYHSSGPVRLCRVTHLSRQHMLRVGGFEGSGGYWAIPSEQRRERRPSTRQRSLLLPFVCQDKLDYRFLLVNSAWVAAFLHTTLQLGQPAGHEQLHLLKLWLNRGVVFVAQGDGGRVTAWRLAVRSRSSSAAAAMQQSQPCSSAALQPCSLAVSQSRSLTRRRSLAQMNAQTECSNECCLK